MLNELSLPHPSMHTTPTHTHTPHQPTHTTHHTTLSLPLTRGSLLSTTRYVFIAHPFKSGSLSAPLPSSSSNSPTSLDLVASEMCTRLRGETEGVAGTISELTSPVCAPHVPYSSTTALCSHHNLSSTPPSLPTLTLFFHMPLPLSPRQAP